MNEAAVYVLCLVTMNPSAPGGEVRRVCIEDEKPMTTQKQCDIKLSHTGPIKGPYVWVCEKRPVV